MGGENIINWDTAWNCLMLAILFCHLEDIVALLQYKTSKHKIILNSSNIMKQKMWDTEQRLFVKVFYSAELSKMFPQMTQVC